jgi:tetratricopeptide (TPR) repeat protein
MSDGQMFLSKARSNIGLLHWSKTLVRDNSSTVGSFIAAENWLQQAAKIDNNRSAWRGLGFIYLAQEQEDNAIAAWQKADGMGEELVRWGHLAQRTERPNEAIKWYERAANVETELGDPWYFIAIVYHEQQLADSRHAIQRALKATYFRDIGISDAYLLQGAIIQASADIESINQALGSVNAALRIDAFSSNAVKAEAYHKRGVLYERLGYNQQDIILEYRQALAIKPDHPWARLRLGYTLYLVNGDLNQAEREIRHAISLSGDDLFQKWAHRYLGDIYRYENRTPEAIMAYQKVLEIDPLDKRVVELLADLLVGQSN